MRTDRTGSGSMTDRVPSNSPYKNADFGRLRRDYVLFSNGLLPLKDFVCVLLAAYLTLGIHSAWFAEADYGQGSNIPALILVAALLAPAILFDRRFGTVASRGHHAALCRCYVTGFAMLVGAVYLLGFASGALDLVAPGVIVLWLLLTFMLTAAARVLLVRSVQRLLRRGLLAENVAIVGTGAHALELQHQLETQLSPGMALLGLFDDPHANTGSGRAGLAGSIDELIELGKTRRIDWILLALPESESGRQPGLVQRLKALSVPIALCPAERGLHAPYRAIDYVAGGMAVTLLANRPPSAWTGGGGALVQFLPRFIPTLLMLPVLCFTWAWQRLHTWSNRVAASKGFDLPVDDYDLDAFLPIASEFGQHRFGYVVTPNVDHVLRLHANRTLRDLYAAAEFVLLDSAFLRRLLQATRNVTLPVCTGSGLVATLFAKAMGPGDRIVVIGAASDQVQLLRERYGLRNLVHFNPPMGFAREPAAIEECLSFIESHSPFRYCLLAVGSPQQEMLARQLKARGSARGLALCVGAAIDFITDRERRAPPWMQRHGVEWLFRLVQNPARMAGRYLVRGPRIFWLLRQTRFVLRPRTATVPGFAAEARSVVIAAMPAPAARLR